MSRRAVPSEAFEDPEHLAPGRTVSLLASRCDACGRTEFPARRCCPACGGSSPEVRLETAGTLCGFTSVLHPPPGAQVAVPYGVGVVELGGSIRVMGLLEGPPGALAIGQAMETVVASPSEDLLTYAFRPRP